MNLEKLCQLTVDIAAKLYFWTMTTTEIHEIGFENSLGPVLPAHLFKSWDTWWIYEFMKNNTWEVSQFVLMLLIVCFLNLCSNVHFIILFLFVLYTIFFLFYNTKELSQDFFK